LVTHLRRWQAANAARQGFPVPSGRGRLGAPVLCDQNRLAGRGAARPITVETSAKEPRLATQPSLPAPVHPSSTSLLANGTTRI
jgi:hypothetical protein